MDKETIEKLAEAAHDVWMEGKIRDGWKFAAITDKTAKEHVCLVPYSELSDGDKQSDRDLVVGIPAILEKAGYTIVSDAWMRETKRLDGVVE